MRKRWHDPGVRQEQDEKRNLPGLVAQGVLAVPIQGSLGLVGTALQLFATISMGIFLATIAGTMPQFGLLLTRVLLHEASR